MIELEASLRRGRRRRRRQLLGGGAAAGIVTLSAYLAGSHLNTAEATASPCEAGPARMDEVWNPARVAKLEQAFVEAAPRGLGASTWSTVAPRLEASTEAWRQMRRDACEATRVRAEQSERLMDLRVACLDRRLLELDAVLELFGRPDEKLVAEAPRMAAELEQLQACADAATLLAPNPEPVDAALGEQLEAMERPIAEARALLSAARYEEARARTSDLARHAEAIGYPHLIARVSILHGKALAMTGEHRASVEHLVAGLAQADRAGDDVLRADLLLEAAYVASGHLQDIPLTEDFLARAEAVIERLGAPARQRARLMNWKAALLQRKGAYAEALAVSQNALGEARRAGDASALHMAQLYHAEMLNLNNRAREALPVLDEAVDHARRLWGADHPHIADLLHTRANAYSRIGDYERTAEIILEGLAIRQRSYGEVHTAVAESYHNLSNALRRLGRKQEALAAAERALEIRTALMRPDHPMVGFSHRVVGIAHHALGQYELALAHVQRAAETSRAISDTHPFLARDHFWLGQIALAMGRLEDAARHFREVMRIDRARLGPENGDQTSHHTALAAVDLARRNPRAVLRHVDRAEALAEADELDTQGEASFLRAQALWLLGQHLEARAAAERATELYLGTPSGEPEEVEKIRSWLAEREPPAAARQP